MRPQGRAGSDTFVRFLGANSRWVSAAAVLVSVGSWPNPGDDEACTAPLANARRTTDADPERTFELPECEWLLSNGRRRCYTELSIYFKPSSIAKARRFSD